MNDKVKILKIAKEILEKKNEDPVNDVHFMCVAIEIAFVMCGGNPKLKAFDIIPEMIKYKPEHIGDKNGAWFGLKESDMKKRMDIIENLIEELS